VVSHERKCERKEGERVGRRGWKRSERVMDEEEEGGGKEQGESGGRELGKKI